MTRRKRCGAVSIATLVMALSFATTAARADDNAKREQETSGVVPDKTNRSSGEANREGTGEGRQTPAEKAPMTNGRR